MPNPTSMQDKVAFSFIQCYTLPIKIQSPRRKTMIKYMENAERDAALRVADLMEDLMCV